MNSGDKKLSRVLSKSAQCCVTFCDQKKIVIIIIMEKLREKQHLLFFFSRFHGVKGSKREGSASPWLEVKTGGVFIFRVCFHDYSKVAIDVLRRSCSSDAMSFTVTTATTYANNRKAFLFFFVCLFMKSHALCNLRRKQEKYIRPYLMNKNNSGPS